MVLIKIGMEIKNATPAEIENPMYRIDSSWSIAISEVFDGVVKDTEKLELGMIVTL